MVSVWRFVVPRVPSPDIKVALLPLLAETEATGVPEFTLTNLNLAEAVVIPPTSRSNVSLFGEMAPRLVLQSEPPQLLQVGAPPAVD